MTENQTPETDLDSTENEVPTAGEFASKDEYPKGSWQDTVQKSSVLFKRSGDAKKRASVLLWTGATAAISEWESKSDEDVNGEGLAADLLIIMGTARKGDVSKIKTVALAVRNNGLDTSTFPNLSKAYAEAIRLTKTAKIEAEEDTAGNEAIEAVAADAPKTATTVESAIKMALALAGDVDEFARVTLDVINHGGDENVAAHRALLRAFAQEVGGRAKPAAPAPVASGDKAGASQATGTAVAETAVAAPSKPKGTVAKQGDIPVQTDKTKTALPPKTPVVNDEAAGVFAEVEAETATPAKKTSAPKPRRA